MNIAQIEINLQKLIATFDQRTFIYELLLAYGLPKASITRLQKGNMNMSKIEGEISWKKKLFFKEETQTDLHVSISELAKNLTHKERFVIVTDYKTVLAIDTKTNDKLDCELIDLPKHYDFFLPWAGMEKAQHANENPADVKAAEKMAKLFDVIKKDNPDDSLEFSHGLNVFLSRLLFCFFAEDTHIFEDCQFSNVLDSHTQADGSDLDFFFDRFFSVLNTPGEQRGNLPDYLLAFPYVNGGLFRANISSPKFSRSSRAAVLASGDQDWSAINPDIFGSMFQAVISADQRGSLGQHYTSVPNIMKVIEPLFLNELYKELEKAGDNKKKLDALLNRMHKLKIFDPACGSGNFLIIAYKELRLLEMKVFKAGGMIALSGLQLSQFYGIEIDDFAGEIAKLALWLAEHQMNVEFRKEFGRTNPTLPLSEAGHIIQGNATRLDWETVCKNTEESEIYILGNPPYLGFNLQTPEQKADIQFVLPNTKNHKYLDYIVCWFVKGARYIMGNSSLAFVTTNSISQGAQAPKLWPDILLEDNEIFFAYPEFVWSNNAKNKAGVICSIIGIRKTNDNPKYLYTTTNSQTVKNINIYLANANNTIVEKRQQPLSDLSPMSTGNVPYDGGNLIISSEERDKIISEFPKADKLILQLSGSKEFINNLIRYCIWIEDDIIPFGRSIPPILDRINAVQESRLHGGKIAKNYAHVPHRFYMTNRAINSQIIIPRHSSIRREYIPMGFLDKNIVISDSAQAIYDPVPYMFSILNSKMHMIWVRTVGGRIKSDYRYSAILCYNTFPFPTISTQRKNEITQAVFRILEEREKNSDKTLAQLYDPDKMPDGLRQAHNQNDLIVEKCYRSTPFSNDEERLEYLFKLYEKMIEEEKNKNTLFEVEKKKRKKKK
jgi:hypothetical protein